MATRVLVTGAGTGASNNLIRSLRAENASLFIVGCHDDRFVLKKSLADRNYLVPSPAHAGLARALRRVVRAEGIDLLVPNGEEDVDAISRLRHRLPCRTFLPSRAALALCQDKYALARFLAARGLSVPRTYPVRSLAGLDAVFRRLGRGALAWCRIRKGAGSLGATPVKTAEQARSWIRYWQEMRGVPATSFTISEYLPGRDFACQSLWQEGRLVLIKTVERLSYFDGWSRPSGVSSIAALAKTVVEPRVVELCADAARALDGKVSGALSVDLKENADGVPCITEINAGRFITMLNLFDFAGKRNMSATYVRLALGEPLETADPYDAVEGYYFVRDVDTLPGVFHADELFEGIEDARTSARARAVHRP